MPYTLMQPQPDLRDKALAYDQRGPGLYEGETAVIVDGERVAVSASSHRMQNGGGASLKAWARWIEEDGTTKTDAQGVEVENDFIHNADAVMIDRYGLEKLVKECLLAVLGEPLTLVVLEIEDGEDQNVPILGWGDEFLLNVSIRNGIQNAKKAKPVHNAAKLLDL
jgi:hypothetical protein